MNLNQNPTLEQLVELFSYCNDNIASHILWVDNNANVHLEPILSELTPAGWDSDHENVYRFRFESFLMGNGYVGPQAVTDSTWMQRVFSALTSNWSNGTRGFIDNF